MDIVKVDPGIDLNPLMLVKQDNKVIFFDELICSALSDFCDTE